MSVLRIRVQVQDDSVQEQGKGGVNVVQEGGLNTESMLE